MRIEILEGYQNGYSIENNSVTLRINTDLLLNQHLKRAVKEVDNIHEIMSDFTKKHKYIIFCHTFRLVHDDEDYLKKATRCRGVLYETSNKYRADGDNLQYQLQNSLNVLVNKLKGLGDSGWYGVHFINIMMKKNDTIVKVEGDERQKIKATHKKPTIYEFIDDTKKNNLFETKIKKLNNKKRDIDELSAKINSRYNNLMIQCGGGPHFKKSNYIDMNKRYLKSLLKKEKKKREIIVVDDTKPVPTPRTYKPVPALRTYKPVPAPRTYKPVPAARRPVPKPRKSVKDMVKQYEDNIILPPLEFRDRPIPKPRTKKPLQAPIPEKRTIFSQGEKALKGYTQSFEIEIRKEKDPLIQSQKSRSAIEHLFKNLLVQTKGFKFVETLQVKFVKHSNDKKILKNGYFNSTTDLIINETDIKLSLQTSQQQILNKIAQWISEGNGWTIQSIEHHYINIVNYNPLKGSSHIKLPQELKNRGLINLQNKDNECFRWRHIRHLNPQDKDPQRIKKTDKQYIEKLDYSSIEFPVTDS